MTWPRTLLTLLGCVTLLSGCEPAHLGPKPVWTAPSRYRSHWHWECPDGYQVEVSTSILHPNGVYCESQADIDRDLENFERSQKPIGGASFVLPFAAKSERRIP